MTPAYSEAQVLSRLSERITRDGLRTTARAMGVDPSHLRRVLLPAHDPARRTLSDRMLTAMGYTRAYVSTPTSPSPERDR